MEKKIVFEEELIINGIKYTYTLSRDFEGDVNEYNSSNEVVEEDIEPMSLKDIPDGMSVAQWIDLICDCGIVLTK